MSKNILYLGLDPSQQSGDGQITHWPIIKIVRRPFTEPAIQQALSNFEQYTHILITSKSTVGILCDYLTQIGIPQQIWAKKITLAVGCVTGKHLETSGIIPTAIAQEETAEGLVEELKKMDLARSHVFWPHSAKARPVIKDFLSENHIRFTDCVFYEPHPNIPAELPKLKTFDEIIFTSPSTVDAFLQIFGGFPMHVRLTPIGPVTARYLAKLT